MSDKVVVALECAKCGAPLPPPTNGIAKCQHCGVENAITSMSVAAPVNAVQVVRHATMHDLVPHATSRDVCVRKYPSRSWIGCGIGVAMEVGLLLWWLWGDWFTAGLFAMITLIVALGLYSGGPELCPTCGTPVAIWNDYAFCGKCHPDEKDAFKRATESFEVEEELHTDSD